MGAGIPNIDPSIMKMIQSSGGDQNRDHLHFMAGLGFTKFADTIKKLHALAVPKDGGGASGSDQPAMPPMPGAQQNQGAAPGGNPLAAISQILPLLKAGMASPPATNVPPAGGMPEALARLGLR